MFATTSMSRFCMTTGLGAVGLLKSALWLARLTELDTTRGRRDSVQPLTADDVSVNRELHACGFYSRNTPHNLISDGQKLTKKLLTNSLTTFLKLDH